MIIGCEKMAEEKSLYGKVQKNTFAMGSFTQWFIQTLFGSWVFSAIQRTKQIN